MTEAYRPKYVPFEGKFTPITELYTKELVVIFPRGREHFYDHIIGPLKSNQPSNPSLLVQDAQTKEKMALGKGTTVIRHQDYVDYNSSRPRRYRWNPNFYHFSGITYS